MVAPIQEYHSIQNECLAMLLRPIVRFCVRHRHTFQHFESVAKIVFIEVAEEEIRKKTEKVNVSRLSVISGLARREVKHLFQEKTAPPDAPLSLLGKVMGQWEQDKHFTDSSGKPRVLTFQGIESEFHRLVRAVSKNINPGTVLFELERAGLALKTPDGIRLLGGTHHLGADPRKGFELLSRDVDTLVQAAEENLLNPGEISNLHIRTEYDNIYKRDLPKIRRWLVNEGIKFHDQARAFLSACDRDINPPLDESSSTQQVSHSDDEAGVRVALGVFSLTEPRS